MACRIDIDKKVYGRNEYNDFYHWTARHVFQYANPFATPFSVENRAASNHDCCADFISKIVASPQ